MFVLERHVQSKYTGKNLFGLLENDPKLKKSTGPSQFYGSIILEINIEVPGTQFNSQGDARPVSGRRDFDRVFRQVLLFRNSRPKMFFTLKFDLLTNGEHRFFLWFLWWLLGRDDKKNDLSDESNFLF